MSTVITIIIAAVLTNNFVLSKFYGCCPFLGVSKKLDSSIGMGAAVVFVMVCAALVTYPIYYFLLEPNDLTYLRTVAFILVIAVFVQLLEMIINDMNRIKFTDFFALLAANAGMLTGLHRCFSHILGRTEHIYLFLF